VVGWNEVVDGRKRVEIRMNEQKNVEQSAQDEMMRMRESIEGAFGLR